MGVKNTEIRHATENEPERSVLTGHLNSAGIYESIPMGIIPLCKISLPLPAWYAETKGKLHDGRIIEISISEIDDFEEHPFTDT